MFDFDQIRRTSKLAAALAVVSFFVTGSMAGAQPTTVKIAVVNLDFVVAQSPAGKALQAKLGAFQKQVQAEVEQRSQTARDIRQQMAEGATALSESKLAELQKKYEDATIAMRRHQDDKQREGQKMQTEGLRAVEKQLEPVFTAIRDEGGYDLILNAVPGVVVMASDRIDITQTVIDRLAATAGN